jgi:hypothetical protein
MDLRYRRCHDVEAFSEIFDADAWCKRMRGGRWNKAEVEVEMPSFLDPAKDV